MAVWWPEVLRAGYGDHPSLRGGMARDGHPWLVPSDFSRPALLRGGLRWVGLPVPKPSPSCHQPVPASLSLGLPPDCEDRAVIACRAGTAATGMGSPWAGGGCVVVVVPAAGPTGCSLLRHRPTAWPWACHPEPEGERGPTHVGAGGSVPVPAASLDGARRTGCERRRPAGVRCRMVPGWPGCQGTGAGPVALPVLPVQSRLLLWSWLVMGREML